MTVVGGQREGPTSGKRASLLEFATALDAALITDVQLAPDGMRVAYVTSRKSTEKESPPFSTLWLVGVDGGQPKRLTSSEDSSGFPRWSPDGKRLAFLSDRKERGLSQIYLLDLEWGGDAIRLTSAKGGVLGLEWSPDGELIAFTAPDAPADEEQEHTHDHDETVVDEGVKATGLWVLVVPIDVPAMPAGQLPESRRISPEEIHVGAYGFSWSPDSRALVTTSTKSAKAHHLMTPELITVDLECNVGHVAHFEGLEGEFPPPRFSPDASTIAFNGADGSIPALFSLQIVASAGGTPCPAIPSYNGTFGSFAWLPDGKRLVAVSFECQQARLVIIDPEARTATDAIAPFNLPGVVAGVSLSVDGRRVAFVRSNDTSYGDVFIADLGGTARQLTDINPWTRDYQFGEVRELSWTSFDGREIEGLLILPVGYQEGRSYPTLLDIHGGPMNAYGRSIAAHFLFLGQFMAQRGYAVLMPNPRGSSGRGSDFLCGIVGCYGDPDSQDVISGIDKLIELGIADPDKLVIGGASGGGFLTNWIITHTDRFKAAVSICGISNWVSFQGTTDIRACFDRYLGPVEEDPDNHWKHSPIRYIKAARTPTLIAFGEQDRRVPPTQGHELYEGLKARGVETKLVLYPREGHFIMERQHQLDLMQRTLDWFDVHLGRTALAGRPD